MMTKTVDVAEALVSKGELSWESMEAAVELLADCLSATDQEKLYDLEADSQSQEQTILKAKPYAEQDAARRDPKNLEVDRAIIQDAFNQDEADLAKLQALEARVSKQAKRAARTMVSAGLVPKQNQKLIAKLVQQFWNSQDR